MPRLKRLKLSLLGPFQASLGDQPLTQFRSDKVRGLLAYLCVESNRPHERNFLASLFWPDMRDESALRNLSQTLTRLREVLGKESLCFLTANRREIAWNTSSAYELDADQFTRSLGRDNTPSDWASGVALYGGEFMAGFALPGCPEFETWLLLKREQYQQMALEAMQKLAALHLDTGDHAQARRYARQQLNLEAWREVAQRQLMRAFALMGNRSEALAQYETCKRILAEELGIEPEAETTALYEQIRAGQLSSGGAGEQVSSTPAHPPHRHPRTSAPPHNLPGQLTPFIGREAELAQTNQWLQEPSRRLVTITGLGGVGKTRLAITVARQCAGQFTGGAWFVPLVSLSVSEGNGSHGNAHARVCDALAKTIVNTLSVTLSGQETPEVQLFNYLRKREVLLVLDNFEHLLSTLSLPKGEEPALSETKGSSAADFVQALLQAAPQVRVLVTSRERLNIQAESVLVLSGLPAPGKATGNDVDEVDGAGDVEHMEIARNSCMQLFVERAARMWTGTPGFRLTHENADHIAHICRLVEGLPLGVELAASWVQHYKLSEIVQAIQNNLDFLASPRRGGQTRQGSMRAVFEYSWQLLSPLERRVLAQASVLRGAFSRAAALAVTDAKLTTLVALVDKSLLHSPTTGRYEMHELLRQFASEKLQAIGEDQVVRERHCAFYLNFVADREAAMYGRHARGAIAEIKSEANNIRQAWQWAVSERRLELIEQCDRGIFYVRSQDSLTEGVMTYERAVEQLRSRLNEEPTAGAKRAVSKLLSDQAYFLNACGRHRDALSIAQLAWELAEASGDPFAQTTSALQQGESLYRLDDYDAAWRWFEHAHAAGQLADVSTQAKRMLMDLIEAGIFRRFAMILEWKQRFVEAIDYGTRARKILQQTGNSRFESAAASALAEIHRRHGDYARSIDYRRQALQLIREHDDPDTESRILNNLGDLHAQLGDYAQAKEYLRQALQLSQEIGNRWVEASICEGLSRVHHHTGDHQAACNYAERALEMNEHGYQMAVMGLALEGAGRIEEAEQAYQRAVQWWRTHASTMAAIAEPLAGLARLALKRGDRAQAMAYATHILVAWQGDHLADALEPLDVYLTCFRTLQVNGDDRAQEVLATAHQLLQDQAAKLDNPDWRHSFLNKVAAHREIVAEFESSSYTS